MQPNNTKSLEQAFNEWFHGSNGGLAAGPDLAALDAGVAFKAGWDANADELQKTRQSVGVLQSTCDHLQEANTNTQSLIQYQNQEIDRLQKLSISLAQDKLIKEIEHQKMIVALTQIKQWDSLNPPDPNTDFPWLKALVDNALEPIVFTPSKTP